MLTDTREPAKLFLRPERQAEAQKEFRRCARTALSSTGIAKRSRGFSTIEIIIALAIAASIVAAIASACFADQSTLENGELSDEALSMAQADIASVVSRARSDFRLVTNSSTTTGSLTERTVITDDPYDPYTTKHARADVSWIDMRGVSHDVSLARIVTDYADASTTDTCDSALSGDWSTPSVVRRVIEKGDMLPLFPPTGHSFSAYHPIAAIDAYHDALYVGIATTSGKTNDSLFVFDIRDPSSPQYLGSIDNNASSIDGVSAIALAGGYAYAGNAHDANFKTCKPGPSCSQLQIFDVSHPGAIPAPSSFLLPTSSPPYVIGSGSGQAVAKSISYADGYVYLGLTKTGSGPEFDIIDVHNPSAPVWIGGYDTGAGVAAIYVRGRFAYLATDAKSSELVILDIHDRTRPVLAGIYNVTSPAGWGDGNSLYQVGMTLFLGLTYATGSPEIYALDVSDPHAPAPIASYAAGASIVGMVKRDDRLFALTSTARQMQILDVSDPAAIRSAQSPIPLGAIGSAFDCERNTLYGGAGDSLSIIGPAV